ncbi:DedA family protein [Arthrobacter sp. JSM 101049]|uniref:DedA family protein n=1 Tax=Arthrobacter sp. JSM 101049 TaxID=929097 RepID=UPI0035622A48
MNELGEGLRSLDDIWVYAVGALFVAVSALIPPVPSTTLFVALGALAANSDSLNPVLLGVAMLMGALAGDIVTYLLALRFDVVHWRILSGRRWQAALAAARSRLKDNDLPLVMTSRFIPLGRLTLNVGSALVPHPWSVFFRNSLIAGIVWSIYSVGVGVLSGLWEDLDTEFAVLLAIVVSLVLGRLISTAIQWWETRSMPSAVVAARTGLRARRRRRLAVRAGKAAARNAALETRAPGHHRDDR